MQERLMWVYSFTLYCCPLILHFSIPSHYAQNILEILILLASYISNSHVHAIPVSILFFFSLLSSFPLLLDLVEEALRGEMYYSVQMVFAAMSILN